MIDIVIPTMWVPEIFLQSLEIYVNTPQINKIIIVDNNKLKRPKSELLNNPKIEIFAPHTNIFVNPAWNEGHQRAKSKIFGIINDDIIVDSSVFEMVVNHNLEKDELIGVGLSGRKNNFKIDDVIQTEEKIETLKHNVNRPIGGQAWSFGVCMFMLRESYKTIPSLYQVWYGDDYLCQKMKKISVIRSNKIKGTISETLDKQVNEKTEVYSRILLDTKNLLKYNHFKDVENWSLPNIVNHVKHKPSMDIFEQEYQNAKIVPSDINQNVHILYDLAKECKTVTEMGVRTGVSTRAFLNTNVRLKSYDIVMDKRVQELFNEAKRRNREVEYIEADVLKIEIEETDLLFIDTFHVYDQLKQELKLHGNKAKKYLAFHDTKTFGLTGEDRKDNKGLLSAIIEFLIENPHWEFYQYKTNNNGLTVLKRN